MLKRLRANLFNNPVNILLMTLFWLHGVIRSRRDPSGKSLHGVGRWWSALLLRACGVRVEIHGIEKVPAGGVYVFVANHLSYLDTPLMFANLPVPFRFLFKDSLLRVPTVGSHLRRGRHIPVVREDARGAARSLAEAARVLSEEDTSVLIFAEGSRSGGSMREFKKGAALVGVRTGRPIVPLAIAGTDQVMPRGTLTVAPGTVTIHFGAPIPTSGLGPADRDALTGRLQEEVARLLEESDAAAASR